MSRSSAAAAQWALLVTFMVVFAGVAAVARWPALGRRAPAKAVLFGGPSEERDSIVSFQARRFGMDPKLAIAVSHVENWGGDSTAVHPKSGAIGLMQVMPFWADSFQTQCGSAPLFDRRSNACRGVLIATGYFKDCGDWECAMLRYLGAECRPQDSFAVCTRKKKTGEQYLHDILRRFDRTDISKQRDAMAFGAWRDTSRGKTP